MFFLCSSTTGISSLDSMFHNLTVWSYKIKNVIVVIVFSKFCETAGYIIVLNYNQHPLQAFVHDYENTNTA